MFLYIEKLFNKNLKLLFIAYILLITIIFISCNDIKANGLTEYEASGLAKYEVTGYVIAIESTNLRSIRKITLQSENNHILDYIALGYPINDVGFEKFTPSHLRYHMLTGEPVRIVYSVLDNQNIIINIQDYDGLKD